MRFRITEMRRAWAACCIAIMVSFSYPSCAEDFASWLTGFKQRVIQAGVPEHAVDRALQNVMFNPNVIELDRKQPESQQTLQQYVDRTVTNLRVSKGRQALNDYPTLLGKVERDFGVPRAVLVALWGKETDYGGFTGTSETISSLATLAYEGRRRAFFEQELLDAIILLDKLGWRPSQMRGSWAGAIGQCQFMPSNYIKYGRDGNNDGRIDLWQSMSDVFYSMANLLRAEGWKMGEGWGQEVTLPASIDPNLIGRDKAPRDLRFWEQQGVRFSKPVTPQSGQQIRLYQPDGPASQAYAIYPNFDVLMRWNKSGYFATAVGVLSDRISL